MITKIWNFAPLRGDQPVLNKHKNWLDKRNSLNPYTKWQHKSTKPHHLRRWNHYSHWWNWLSRSQKFLAKLFVTIKAVMVPTALLKGMWKHSISKIHSVDGWQQMDWSNPSLQHNSKPSSLKVKPILSSAESAFKKPKVPSQVVRDNQGSDGSNSAIEGNVKTFAEGSRRSTLSMASNKPDHYNIFFQLQGEFICIDCWWRSLPIHKHFQTLHCFLNWKSFQRLVGWPGTSGHHQGDMRSPRLGISNATKPKNPTHNLTNFWQIILG